MTQKALQVDGVLSILTAKDLPVNEWGLETPDQPIRCGPGSNNFLADRVRWIGDQIAVIIAESEGIASRAQGLIDIKQAISRHANPI